MAALAVAIALVAPPVAGAPAPGAQAYLTSVGGDVSGSLQVGPSVADNSSLTYARQTKGLVSFDRSSSSVSSILVGNALVSDAEASVSGVDILDGVVTADSVAVVATATAGKTVLSTATDGCDINGLQVNGKPVAPDSSPFLIDGVGELTILGVTASSAGGSASVEATGLRLVLDHPVGDQPAGAVIVVGDALATADTTAATDLYALSVTPANPKTVPAPTPKPKPLPTPSATAKAGSGGSGSGRSSGAGGAGAGGSGGATRTGGHPPDYGMPAPTPPTADILKQFPGAVFPVDGQVSYVDTFGAYRADMPNHKHEGNDIFAKMGTPIVAVLAGTVELDTSGIGGNNVHLTDAAGDYFYYAHMVHFAKGLSSGDQVAKGQVIGYVGETGDAQGTSPHCHFEIHPAGGAAVDPYPYLEAWRAGSVASGPAGAAPATTPATADSASSALLPRALLLARHGVLGPLAAVLPAELGGLSQRTRTWAGGSAALQLLVIVGLCGGAMVVRRGHAPALPELLGPNETVVRVVRREPTA